MKTTTPKRAVFIALFTLVTIPVVLLLIIGGGGLYSYYTNLISVENINKLEETNYEIYYKKPTRAGLWKSEINGEEEQRVGIPEFGKCSPDAKYTVYEERGEMTEKRGFEEIPIEIYLYNFETGEKVKLLDSKSEFEFEYEWTPDGTKIGLIEASSEYKDKREQIRPRVYVFDTEGELLRKKEASKKVYEKWSDGGDRELILFELMDEFFKRSFGICQTTHRIRALKDVRFKGSSKIEVVPPVHLGEPNAFPGLFYEDKRMLPWVDGFKGGRLTRVKNIFPDDKVALKGPKSESQGICFLAGILPRAWFKGACGTYLYIYDPKLDNRYRVTKIDSSFDSLVNWRFKNKPTEMENYQEVDW